MLSGNAAIQITRVEDADARARLAEIAELFQFVAGSVDEILETSPELFRVREAAGNIFSLSQTLLDEASHLANGFENLAGGRTLDTVGGYALGVLALASIILIGLVMVRTTNRQLRETAEKNERNQQAIMRLLDEIEELADGDLTVTVSVTEDFTGAIADSINYSVDQLRDLVATINHSAVQVAAAVQDTQNTARQLAKASEHQAEQISEPPKPSATWSSRSTGYPRMLTNRPRWPNARWPSPTRVTRWCTTPSMAWTTFASRSRTPPSGSSAWVSLLRKSATLSA